MKKYLRLLLWVGIAVGIGAIGFCFPNSLVGIFFPCLGGVSAVFGYVIFSDPKDYAKNNQNNTVNKDERFYASTYEGEEPDYETLKSIKGTYLKNKTQNNQINNNALNKTITTNEEIQSK